MTAKLYAWAMQDAMVYDGERMLKERGEAALKRMPPLRTARKVGTLAPGQLADLAVLSKDYLGVSVEEIGGIHSLLTMVGGRVVYADGPFAKYEERR